jgi:hypothetical protein
MVFPKYPGTEIADCMAELKALEQSIDKDIEASKPELVRIEKELAKLEQMDVRNPPPTTPPTRLRVERRGARSEEGVRGVRVGKG